MNTHSCPGTFLRALSTLFASALFLVPFGTHAGGPIVLCDSGRPFVWPNEGAAIPFNPDLGDLGPLDNFQAVTLTQLAFDVWNEVPTSTAIFFNAGPLPLDVDITNFAPFLFPQTPDGLNAIVFDDTGEIFDLLFGQGSGILGFAGPEWLNPSACEIMEGVAFLNGPAFGDSTAALDVMVHEFGHYAGLAHTVVNGQILAGDTSGPTPDDSFGLPAITDVETLYPFYFGPGSDAASLATDDRMSLSALYPEPGFAGATVTLAGTIRRSTTQPVSGVNVIARNIANPFEDAVSGISGDHSLGTPGDPYTGTYTLHGLTPGAQYAVFVDEIFAGGFSTPLAIPFPGQEEFYNGPNESDNLSTPDPVLEMATITAPAGTRLEGIDVIFNVPRPGENLPIGDDGSVELPLPFAFELAGTVYRSVFVNANGNLTFGVPDSSFFPTREAFLAGPPRIAGLWDDLNPTQGGTVTYSRTHNSFRVAYSNVPEWYNTGSVSFEIRLKKGSDQIEIHYGSMSSVDGLSGFSAGGTVTSGFESPSDLSAFRSRRINLRNLPALYEVFDAAHPNDLTNDTLRFTGTSTFDDNWAEPNNSLEKARRIFLPFDSKDVRRFTELEPTGADVDYFRFWLKAGDVLVARTISGMPDTLLGLFKISGPPWKQKGVLVAQDDDGGPGFLSTLLYQVPSSGDYVLAVGSFPDFEFTGLGFTGGRYVLDIVAVPPERNNLLFNGSFEFGLLGWTAEELGTSLSPWVAEGAGSGSGFGLAPTAPQHGVLDAWNGFDGVGPMAFTLYQDVTLPTRGRSAKLHWKNRVQWNFLTTPPFLPRTHSVQLRDPATGDVLQDLLMVETATEPGIGDSGWTSHSIDVSAHFGRTVRVWFEQFIPEPFTGPGQLEVDAVRLEVR